MPTMPEGTRTPIDDDGDGTIDRIEFDFDEDGNIDRTVHLNADGGWERVERDDDDDGTIDRTVHRNTDGSLTINRIDFDDDGDGTTDRSVFYTHNADRNRIQTGFDDDGDGTTDRIETYTYDENGNRTRIGFDTDADGTIDRITHYTFDDDGNGRVTRRDADLDDDGTIDRIAHVNADGRWERVERDDDDDGTIDRITRYAFDDDGNRTRAEFDTDADGTVDRITHFAFDGDGNRRVTRRDFDRDDDGNIDRTIHLNADGGWERVELDDDDDGTIDRTVHRNTDNTNTINRIDFDDDGDGTTDRSEFYTQNADNNRNRASFDDDGDGTIDRNETYTYDVNDRVSQTRFDDDEDGTTDRSETYTYDDDDRVSQASFDDDADSTNDRIESYSYDLNGNLIRTEFDDDADGIIERAENYDLNGNLIRTEIDTDNDGVLDRTEIDLNNDGNPERVEIRNPSGQVVREEIDNLSDGTPNRVNYYWYPEDLDGDRDPFRQDDDTDGDGDLDRVSYEGDADFAGDFPNHAGLEVVRLGFVGRGDGFTTLTIPDGFVFAGASGSQVRIEGGSTDTLRFDMDDFTEGDRVIVEGQDYRSFAADDGSWSFLVDADVTLIDPTPVFTSPATANAQENQTAAYMAVATDEDSSTLVYSLSGTDAALFTIDSNTGEVSFITAPDFEAPGDDGGDNVYDIIVTASDGTNSTDHNVAITVTNENDNIPVFTSPATANARENQTAAYMAAATDADGDALVYSLSGTDAALFTIDAATGEVSFMAAPDFEAPGDDDRDNVYDIIVTASDGTNSTDHNVAITVTNENDNIPVFTSPAAANAQENQTAAYMAAATDADGDTLVYSLSGTDAALFTIDSNTGEVSFRAAPDFEAPGDDGGDNVYDIIVTASDGTNSTDHNVAITVTNENDNIPVFTSPATANARENQTAAYMAAATDADGDTLVYSLSGTDAALFTIDANTGEVSFIEAPDFEAPGDDGGDNVYDIIVTASDGTTDTEQAVAITVTDVNELVSLSSLDLSSLDGTNGFTLTGIDAFDQSGRSVSSAGDVNGDGYDDLIIGTPGGDPNGPGSGESYIVYGGASAPGTDGVLDLSRLALDGNGFTLAGIDEFDNAGFSVSSAGDVNGDGYDDLIIGAFGVGSVQGEYDTIPGPGEAYVVYGGATGADLVLDRSTLDGTRGFALTGIDAGDRSGFSVSSAGDVNGDGYDDLIIGAYGADPNGNSSGETYIVYGGARAPGTGGVLDLGALDGSNGFTLTGIDGDDNSGSTVSSAGDVNGDGYDDLIIGARYADPDGDNRAGETYIIYGGASAPGTDGVLDLSALDGTNGFILTGVDAYDNSGFSVSSAGDVNGDGYDDLIIGARNADPNGDMNAGETYIVYGGASAPIGGRFNLSTLNGSNGFTLTGIDGDDQSGSSVSSAGDVNGDGYDDLIIGASGADPDGDSNAGETYIVYGGASAPGTGGVLDLSDLDGTNGFILTGIDAGDLSGLSVSSAGDVNGDGYDDLIIGARYGDPNGNRNAGETYVIYGGATGTESLTPVTAQGTAAADNFTGNAGADSFTAIATNDVVRGGAGDDTISVTALDFAAIDGGTGVDTLVLNGAGLALDLTGAGHAGVDNVEVFDLSGTGANSLVLDAQAVFDVTEERAGGVASLDVLGDADDRVDLSGSNFALTGTAAEDGVTYNVYRDGNAQLRIEDGVQVQIPVTTTLPVFTSPATANAQENQTAAYMAAATDADGDALVYSLSGTDAALFTIDANTGEVSFIEAPDFEAPGDDGGDNVYDIIVTASDGSNSTDHNVAITVTNENDNIPVFTSPATANARENQTAAYMAAATDGDGDTLVYSLSGTDAALFTIDAATGEVSFMAAPDFEAPGDDGGDNVYDIIVTASDGSNRTNHNVAITVTDVSEVDNTYDENGTLIQSDFDDDGDGTADRSESYTYDESGNLVRTDFDDDADGTTDRSAFDDDGDGTADRSEFYTYDDDGNRNRTRFDDDNDGTLDRSESYTYDANDRVSQTNFDDDNDGTTDRNESYTYDANDRVSQTEFDDDNDGTTDRSESYTYDANGNLSRTSFDDDADSTNDRIESYSYDLNGNLIRTEFDDDADGIIERAENYDLNGNLIRTEIDTDNDGVLDRTEIDLNNDGNPERVEIRNPSGQVVREEIDNLSDGTPNRVNYYWYPEDLDGDRDPFRQDDDTDGDGDLDRVSYEGDADFAGDFPNHAGLEVVRLGFVGRGDGFTTLTIPDGFVFAGASGSQVRIEGGSTDTLRFDMDDFTEGDRVIVEGQDYRSFAADDGSWSFLVDADVTLIDPTPVFTSPTAASVAENQTAAYMAVATDEDSSTLVYSLSGTDAALFTIDADTGEVSFRAAPDFEAPGDDGGDNVYDIIVTASDGENNTNHNVAITVTNENDNIPVFTSPATANVRENQVAAYMAAVTDADGDTLVYSLSGTDAARFTIDANTGEVRFRAAPDFEAPGDDGGDNVYDIIVTASDGTTDTEQAVAITVTDVNDNVPVFTSPATANAQENQTAAYMAAATDAEGDTLVYSLSGTDSALFTIDAATGEVSFIEAPDFEAPGDANGDNVYDIIVTASDGTTDTEQAVAITVTNDNDNAPVFTSPATANAQENQTAAYMAAATDADGDTLVYSLSGTDAARFTINANTGEVSFITAPDFEAPGDDDRDNVYDIIVTASDGTTDTEQAVAIRVRNENDNIPVFTSPATANAQENQTAAYMAVATDADGDTLVYSLSGTDAARFTINATTGEVSFIEAPDFEVPGDDDRDNVYDIIVTASDGTTDTEQAVAITVTSENDNIPVFTSPATADAQENQTAAYMAAATDADGDTLVYSLSGTDSALFTIDADTGEVSFITAPDFEAPGDDNGDNVYDIIVTAFDGDNIRNHNVAITVTNENDIAPVFTSPTAVSVAENQVAAYEAVATDADGDTLVYSLSGTDSALFTIDAATGEVSFIEAPDFEAPGDDGGDNVYDIIVTASDGATDTEQAVAITVTDGYDPDLSALDGTNGFALTGIDAGDRSGRSVSSAGDVNGDGYDDLIIGARNAGPNGPGSGETYIVYGGASAPGTDGELNLGALDGTNGFILTGIDGGDESGRSVSSAGDVNGDGYDDLIIGASRGDPDGDSNAGEAYIVYGVPRAPGTDGVLDLSTLDGTNGFTLTGIDAGDYSGFSVSSAGDVNGDGYDDLIIGARGADPNGNIRAGETYIVYGGTNAPGTGGVLDLGALDGSNGFILNGIDRDDGAGRSVSSAGDVNGDGYDDLVIGTREGGETYVVYGGASAPGSDGMLDLSDLDGTNGFILNGISAYATDLSVSSAGDVNGDGYDDLVIGSWTADPNGGFSGETYIVYGGASAPGTGGRFNLSMLDGTNGFTLTGIDAYDGSGYSVSSAGDVNGDGYDDLIIGVFGAYGGDPNRANETYVVYGGASAPGTDGVLDLSSLALDGSTGFIVNGNTYDYSGISVSSAGDVNGDGYDDLVIGASYADPNGRSGAGESYVLYGGATGTESLTPVTAQGTAAADNFTGNAGDDSFTGIATDDVVRGGAGDDRISVTALDFAAIDGGTGVDTLVLNGAGLALDLTGPGNAGVDSVEVFDLSGTGANTLVLDAQAVFDVTEEREGGLASLDVLGDADDRVDLGGGNFILTGTATEDGVTYNVYRDGNAQLRIENGVQVQIPVTTTLPVFTSPATATAQENQTAAYEAAATDADGDTLVYSLSGTDAALFTINANTGEVSFRAAPDFEAPGDDGGDNVYDITVTAFDGTNRTDHNVAITVTDVNELVPLSSLDGTNGFTLTGIDRQDFSGSSVSSAGDVNGDGYDDLIIGAPNADPNGDNQAGETYIVYGGASAPGTGGVLDLGALDGTNGFILTGIDAGDLSGQSVSSAGDVNGDGYDDLIIGAQFADPNGDSSGETYIVYGGASAPGTGGVLDLSDLDGTNGFILTGIDAGDDSGFSVSSAGDVNGDGYDDLIIGATGVGSVEGEYDTILGPGEAYVVYGGATGADLVLDRSTLDGTRGFALTGIANGDTLGISVSSAGDVNGDGYDDLIIGATGVGSEAGATYIVYGRASAPGTAGVLDLGALDGTNGFTLNGIDADDGSGRSVSSAGDVNGDGYDDLIIGARYADPNGESSGETYIVYGGATAPGTDGELNLGALDGTNGFILTGIDGGDESGRSVSSAGDVNGDGYDDLIIGAYRADPNGNNSGETYIVYGGASAPGTDGVLDLSMLNGTNGFILTGIDVGDYSGWSVSSAGDVNGDGYDDLIIGAPFAAPNGEIWVGETYIVYGGATGTESLVPVTAQGTAAADNFTGNAGDDSFTDIATNDVVRGGAGNDTISITALDFAAIDGGTGVDTLVLNGAGLALDLTGAGHAGVDSVEVFDLSGTGANSLVLDAQAVFDVTEEREGGAASLDVLGDADDRVDLSGSSFALSGTVTEDGVTYNVYRDGNAQVRVEDGVSVTLAATGSQSARSLTADPDLMPDMSHADAREGIDGTGLHSPGHSLGMDVDFMDGFSEPEFEWTGVVVTGLAPPDMQAPAPGPLSSGQAINLFDVLTGYDLSYDLLL